MSRAATRDGKVLLTSSKFTASANMTEKEIVQSSYTSMIKEVTKRRQNPRFSFKLDHKCDVFNSLREQMGLFFLKHLDSSYEEQPGKSFFCSNRNYSNIYIFMTSKHHLIKGCKILDNFQAKHFPWEVNGRTLESFLW